MKILIENIFFSLQKLSGVPVSITETCDISAGNLFLLNKLVSNVGMNQDIMTRGRFRPITQCITL